MTTKQLQPHRRVGRVHWQKPKDPKPLELIQQGYQALNYLAIFPALTGWQACKLLFLNQPNRDGVVRSEAAARRAVNRECLRPLKNLGLVGVKAVARLDNPLAKWELNYLTASGHQALNQYRTSLGLASLPFTGAAELTYRTINPHTMAVIDAGISAYTSAPLAGLSVDTWLADRVIRSLVKQGQIPWPMEPDALVILRDGERRQAFFIEVDLGTESIDSPRANSFSTKLAKYKQYFTTLRREDPWLKDLPQPQLLVVAPSQRRMANLMEATRLSGGRSAYWFTISEYLEPPYALCGEVWQRIGLEGYYSPVSLFAS